MMHPDHLFMVRPDLDGLPTPILPTGFEIHAEMPGSVAAWRRRILSCLGSEAVLGERAFDCGPTYSRLCEFAVMHKGALAGTVTASQELIHGANSGYIDMLAVRPEYRGRGLGRALLAAALSYFRKEGFERAVLDTSAHRAEATGLFLALGFLPFPETCRELDLWRGVLRHYQRDHLAAMLRVGVAPDLTRA